MKLIDQHTKKIMEECKSRAKTAGLSFDQESIEYIVTNYDMLELSPKIMIPTLYDYWVHDVEVLKEQGKYKIYPSNPYETVINSRPAISFYNDNNPDWMNIMIFYHVIGHIDFFQNNIMFENTWSDDFVGQALADKRLISHLRTIHGRWVDYVIEFSRAIDNITGYFKQLQKNKYPLSMDASPKITYYFEIFLQNEIKAPQHEYFSEIERFNKLIDENKEIAEAVFFSDIKMKHPEFHAKYEKYKTNEEPVDIMDYIIQHSLLLKKEENNWMQSVITIVRNTANYFAPQIRTKIINEGWASYWHDELFRGDDRIKGHEIEYAKLNAGVTSLSRIGVNPYAIGMRLVQYVEELYNKGKMYYKFQKINDSQKREIYDANTLSGKDAIFELRKNFSDFMLINTFVDQDFVDEHNLFVVGKNFNQQKGTIEYYIKSKKAEDYKEMLLNSLYHPPVIDINKEKTNEHNIYLSHRFEGKQLIKDFIADTMMGIEFLWGGAVQLETTEIIRKKSERSDTSNAPEYKKVLYTMKDRKLTRQEM